MSLKSVISERQKKQKQYTWKQIHIFEKDPITPGNFQFKQVLNKIAKFIPKKFFQNIDSIYVGDFSFLNKREAQAVYENSSIFVTNSQESIDDMCDDIIHEIAHSIEEIQTDNIYSDGMLEKEFLLKRKSLHSILKSEGYPTDLQYFMNVEYSQDFDSYLYSEIGYSALDMMSANIFYSPYAATSLREYFANGFEAVYFYRDAHVISKLCPVLYKKIDNLFPEE